MSWKTDPGRVLSPVSNDCGTNILRSGQWRCQRPLGQLEHSYETRKGYWKGGLSAFTAMAEASSRGSRRWARNFRIPKSFTPCGYSRRPVITIQRTFCANWLTVGEVGFRSGDLSRPDGNIMFIGSTTENTQNFFDEINDYGFDLGGAGPCVRTAMSCVGSSRVNSRVPTSTGFIVNWSTTSPMTCTAPHCRTSSNSKSRGFPNDCMNSIERADMAVIGTWRDDIRIDEDEWKSYVQSKGRQHVIDNIITRCPSSCMSLKDDDTVEIDNRNWCDACTV
ncbi:MAG: hypothetical protein Ct9H300mP16_18170 [Pseudomonadota bacterium]|nr:MAG: hypothetical protein Ct9H300mP16_18170 [Pseudomonadota bacterium]